jgi:RNA polymerase sigma factor (sigma-70 family)
LAQPPDDKRRPRGYRGALSSYLGAIRRYKLLTRSGEHRLATASQQGVAGAENEMVEANLRLVVKIAKDYRNTHVPFEDLISEGNLGLMEAAHRFDPSRGVRFVSYATWWIRKYMLRAVDRQAHQSSSPRPESTEVGSDGAGAGGTPRRAGRQRILSFEDFMQNSGDRNFIESFASEDAADPEDRILENQLAEALVSVLDRLPLKERGILVAHYGLDGGAPKTLQAIGGEMGLTRERVRQLELRALDRARRLLQTGRSR